MQVLPDLGDEVFQAAFVSHLLGALFLVHRNGIHIIVADVFVVDSLVIDLVGLAHLGNGELPSLLRKANQERSLCLLGQLAFGIVLAYLAMEPPYLL